MTRGSGDGLAPDERVLSRDLPQVSVENNVYSAVGQAYTGRGASRRRYVILAG